MIAEGPVPALATWHGDLLWPQELPDAEILDFSGVAALGSWAHAWFRRRGQRCVVGASSGVRRQLQDAGLPILWYASVAEAQRRDRGVTRSERDMLFE